MSNTITVSGHGQAGIEPDLVVIDIGVSIAGESVTTALRTCSEVANSVHRIVAETVEDSTAVQTIELAIHPEHDRQSGAVVGHRVTNRVNVTLDHPGRLGEVIDRVAQAGGEAVTIDGIRFVASSPRETAVRARELAWTDARTRAEHLATLAGLALGKAVTVTEGGGWSGGPQRMMAGDMASMPVAGGTQLVTVELTVSFAVS